MAKVAVNHDVLKWARESMNLSLEDVAYRMKKSVDIIQAWEEGQDAPTYSQLEKLAYDIYKRPLAVFFFPNPPKEESPKKSFRTLPEFEYNKFPASLIRLFRRAQSMQIKLNELCEGKNPAERNILDELVIAPNQSADQIVNEVRDYLGIPLQEQISWKNTDVSLNKWRDVIEKCGVFVFKDAFKEQGISGFCLYDNEFPIIYINNSMPKTRQIFTLFHELVHLLFKTGGVDKISDEYIASLPRNDRKIEVFCNQVAGDFLVPEYDFKKQLTGLYIDDKSISALANRYAVSREVILRKLLDEGLVSQKFYIEKATEWIEEAKAKPKTGGDYYATKVVYLGHNYLDIVFSNYYRNRISLDQAAEYLSVKTNQVTNFENAWVSRGLS